MTATFPPNDPVPRLMDELVDGLYLLYECRRRGVPDVDRLMDYIEYKLDQIEHHRLGMSSELFATLMIAEEADDTVAC